MKARDEDLGMLLQRERRHLIPTYQRDYEWTEEGQWQLLADDLLDVADRLAKARESVGEDGDRSAADDTVGPHFLGAVVLEGMPPRGASVTTVAVIDGQQRLTTIFLMLRSLTDLLVERGLTARAKQVRKMILISRDEVVTDEEQYKLWPRRRDRAEWTAVMADELPALDHPYAKARIYFHDRFSNWVDGLSQAEADKAVEILVDAVTLKVRIVVVDLDNSDDAQLIFEVLNGRQTPLSAADLVKNLIFMRAGVSDQKLDAMYDEYWAAFDEKWWSESVGRGHAARGRRDQLLATWLTIETGDEVNLGRLYGDARRYLTKSSVGLEEILRGIRDLATEYRQIYERSDGVPKNIAAVYARMEKLGVTTAVPLLAWLRTLPASRLSVEQHERAVAAVDSFVMRRLMTSGQTRGYGPAFIEVMQAARAAGPDVHVDDAVVQAFLKAPHALSWPTDAEVEAEFADRPFYGRISQERIRMILGPIDVEMQRKRRKSENATFAYEELTVEHIMPQDWKAHWPIALNPRDTFAVREQERNRMTHRLGNLTLITGPLNSAASNGPWSRKRPALAKHDLLALNDAFKEDVPWDEAAIDSRGKELAALTCSIWARPADSE